jgi:hypothetical protein
MAADNCGMVQTQESLLQEWLYYSSYSTDNLKNGLIFSQSLGMYIPPEEDFYLEMGWTRPEANQNEDGEF